MKKSELLEAAKAEVNEERKADAMRSLKSILSELQQARETVAELERELTQVASEEVTLLDA